jgi:hypothetical protein
MGASVSKAFDAFKVIRRGHNGSVARNRKGIFMSGKSLSRRSTVWALAGLVAISVGPSLQAQQKASESDTQEQNIDTYVNLLREDVEKQKVAITSQLMQLSPEQAATFWPIYNEYAKELSGLGDLRLRAIKEYAANYSSLSDEKATELVKMRFEYEEKLLALKKKYFEQLSKALTLKLAARFFQIENQLLDVIDLQVASNLPVIQ